MVELNPFEREMIATYRGWHVLNKKQGGLDGSAVVDIDLAPRFEPIEFTATDQVRGRLEYLLDKLPDDQLDREYLKKRLKASLMVIKLASGDEIPYAEYVEGTTGVKPDLVPKDKLDAQAQQMDEMLQEVGLRFDADSQEEFEKRFVLPADKILPAARQTKRWAKQKFRQYLEPTKESVEPSLKPTDEPYWALISTDENGKPFFKWNTHERYPTSLGGAAVINAHEVLGHLEHLVRWRAAIKAGKMSAAAGVVTLHGPEVTQMEAVAMTTEELLTLGDPKWEYAFEGLHSNSNSAVMHNALVMINTGDEKTAVDYAIERQPLQKPEHVKSKLIDSRDNMIKRTYYACYMPAAKILEPLVALNPASGTEISDQENDRLRGVMQAVYSGAYTPEQMRELVAG